MKYLMLLPFLFLSIVSSAQERGGKNSPEKRQKIEALKIGFITEELELTPEESEKFWPVYRKHQADRKALKSQYKRRPVITAEMPEAEIEAFIKQKFELEQKELDLKKLYYRNLKGILPMWKVASLPKAEKDFRKMILSKVKDGRGRR